MAHVQEQSQGTQPPPLSERGHPMPRRATPEKSVTLRHHRLARDASMKPEPASIGDTGSSPRRNSSGDSGDTGQSDPKKWFDRSNRNPPAAFDHASMDVDPPFFQKQSGSSDEDANGHQGTGYPYVAPGFRAQPSRPTMPTHSSIADDYRSVIDDLTIENKRLKDELKRYRQFGPDLLRKDKLFEIKIHALPRKKKRELEATLRDFASSLDESVEAGSSLRQKSSKHADRLHGSSSNSKHASTSSSHSRPVDSAYASMSTGPSSVGPNASNASLGRPALGKSRSSADRTIEAYLQDIPQGLLPRHVALTDKDKKKLVVRRLEQLFTGRMGSRYKQALYDKEVNDAQVSAGGVVSIPPQLSTSTTDQSQPGTREARICLPESGKKSNHREGLSVSNSNDEHEMSGIPNGTQSGSGSNEHSANDNSPKDGDIPEQRATRPRDLDPDRVQVPQENMQYIRHLGVMAPEYLSETRYRPQDVSMDADGWIHLNLLCNLAQLHILNVTPDYIRSAVSERSAKFQLSRDGRKIRWRGGTEGTKFSSDSSGGSSQRSPDTEIIEGSNDDGARKRQKLSTQASVHSSKAKTKLGPGASASSESFHYKPMFIHNQSPSFETSMDETGSPASYAVGEQSNLNSRSRSTGLVSGSASSPRKKRRHDGAIIYYTGAPFCLDLSGDSGDLSPTTYLTSSGQEQNVLPLHDNKPGMVRSASGSSLPYRPLVDLPKEVDISQEEEPEYVCDDTECDDEEFGFCWSENPEKPELKPLESCMEPIGLGGVTPEDHFAILVLTRHPMNVRYMNRPGLLRLRSDESDASVANRIAALSTSSPRTPPQYHDYQHAAPHIQIQVLQERYKALKPMPLPPPAIFYPPFTETTESEDSGFEDDYGDGDEDDSDVMMDESDDDAVSQVANPHQSDNDFARMAMMDSDVSSEAAVRNSVTAVPKVAFAPIMRRLSRDSAVQRPGDVIMRQPDSSGATAGGEASGYSSSDEESTS